MLGEGLVGQCYLERDIIFMTNIPKEYINITSGLGEATPNCLLIVPLIVNDKINGVMELASFKKFQEHEVEFIKKLAENIASIIDNAKVSEQTKSLLVQSIQQSEMMRAQEEEMRQNMEELVATQEEIQRKQIESESKTEMMDVIIESIPFPIFNLLLT
jgi:GAF domain-containing protein